MVDINLFEDEEEQLGKKEKSGDTPGKKEGGLSGDSLKEDDFSFDEDPVESSLDPFDEPGIRPEFNDENAGRPKSSKGGGKPQKVSPVLIGLGVLVVAVAVYMQFFMSTPKNKTVLKTLPLTRTVPVKRDSTGLPTGGTAVSPVSTAGSVGGASNQTVKYVDVAKAILDKLGREKQFVVLLLKNDQFFIEYASRSRGASGTIGKQIQSIIGAEDFTASREEQKKVREEAMYFGVISGKLPAVLPPANKAQKVTPEQFIEQLKTQMSQKGLNNTKIQKFSEYSRDSKLQTPVSLRAEGARNNVVAFLEALKSMPGNYELRTLIVVPQDIEDLQANQLKMVVDFAVQTF
jgi:hypothetical protein